ncbi:MAG: hypothetical protein AAFP90_13605, partial [Planctomycetota bacterium]
MSDSTSDASPAEPIVGRSAIIGVGFILVAVTAVIWKSSLDGTFQFDDFTNILNRSVDDSVPIFTDHLSSNRPVGTYSLALNWYYCGESPRGYHLFNLAIHLANVVLVYTGVLLSRITWLRSRGVEAKISSFWLLSATITALFWGIHPLNTQAVTYIVQRFESLAALGYLGAWVGLLIVTSTTKLGTRIAGGAMLIVFAWLGMLSKEIFATAPLTIFLFDRLVTADSFRNVLRRRWLVYAGMLTPFVWFVPSVTRWLSPASESSSMGFGMKQISSWEYLRTQPEVILHYLRLSFWPHPQSIDYAWRVQQNPTIYLSLGAIIVAVIATAACLYYRGLSGPVSNRSEADSTGHGNGESEPEVEQEQNQRSRWIRQAAGFFGWGTLAFFFILAPTSSLVPIADLAFEHRMYLPLTLVVCGGVFASAFVIRRLWQTSNNRVV